MQTQLVRRAFVLAIAMSLSVDTGLAAAQPGDGLRDIQSWALANLNRAVGECTQAAVSVSFVAGDNLQDPIGSGKPTSWSDVTVRLDLTGTCEGTESATFEGWTGVPPTMETFEQATLDGIVVTLAGGAGETLDAFVDLTWTGVGDPVVRTERRYGNVRAERSVSAELAGVVSFGANDRWGESLALTPEDQHDARLGWAAEVHTLARPACIEASSGLTSWWSGDGTAMDRVGGFDAVAHGDASFGGGLVRAAFKLDGDGDYLEVADDPGVNVGSGDFTVSLWVRFDDTSGEQVLVEKWFQGWDVPSEGWTLTKLEDQSILLAVSAADGFEVGAVTGPGLIEPDRWYHVAGRRTGSEITVFVEGMPLASASLEGASGWDLSTWRTLLIGRRSDDRYLYVDGAIDEVQLSVGTAVSDAELWLQWAVGPSGTCRGQ